MRLFRSAVLLLAVFAATACSAAATGDAANAPYKLGEQYRLVRTEQTPADPKRISVEEFFWYGCPHCFHLDPELSAWVAKKPADVDFHRVPNSLGRAEGELHARAFYIAQTLGILDKTHKALFEAIQVQHLPMSSLESIRALYVEVAGIKPSDFDQVANGFMVEGDLQKGETLSRDYGITSVPTIVIGGKYQVVGQIDQMKVVDYVVDKVRKERQH